MNFKKSLYSKNKIRLIVELIVLFIAIPVLLTVCKLKVPLMLILLLFGLIIFLFLKFDPNFDKNEFNNFKKGKFIFGKILIFFIPAAFLMVLMIYFINQERLFFLVKKIPWLLLLIIIFYPLFSVLPQTIIYRLFFFHRYDSLFKDERLKIILSAVFFSLGHLLYKNVLVLILAFIAGLIFSYHFSKTKSLIWSFIEHSLYGVWLFASGLGYFFVSQFVQ